MEFKSFTYCDLDQGIISWKLYKQVWCMKQNSKSAKVFVSLRDRKKHKPKNYLQFKRTKVQFNFMEYFYEKRKTFQKNTPRNRTLVLLTLDR